MQTTNLNLSPKEQRVVERLIQDYEFRFRNTLKIRTKEGKIEAFQLNKAQKYIHKKLEEQKKKKGYVRALILKGRQQGCCYSLNTRVLTADYRWIRIDEIQVGDRIIAVDETLGEKIEGHKRQERRFRTAVVEAKAYLKKEVYEVVLDNGVTLVVTGEHRHLCQKRKREEVEWRAIIDTEVGDLIRVATPKPYDNLTLDDAWFGGLLDGEGTFGANPAIRIGLSQVNGPVLERAKRYLQSRNIHFYELIDRRRAGTSSKLGDKAVHCLRVDRLSDVLKLLTLTRPTRFVDRPLYEDKKLPFSAQGFKPYAQVLSIKSLGVQDVVDLQTSEKTFIAEGLVSHNSTYISARFFDVIMRFSGLKVFILAHRDDATNNLYGLVDRYYENYPNPLKVPIKESNSKRLFFANSSGYGVGTAGGGSIGRSDTIQLLHMSECAFYENTDEISSGIMQTVPDIAGTEIILESTANGTGNMFHQMCMDAMNGKSDFELIFVPWFWQEEYRLRLPQSFTLSDEEIEYKTTYNLDDEQIMWRRNKINIFVGKDAQFRREYPATVQEAFEASQSNKLIPIRDILDARACVLPATKDRHGIIVGVDPANEGKDRSVIVFRQGRNQFRTEVYRGWKTDAMVGRVIEIIREYKPVKVFIDKGYNPGVYDGLVGLNWDNKVVGVYFGQGADDPTRYANKRAEMWDRMRSWFEDKPVRIEDDEEMQNELVAVGRRPPDKLGRLILEKKEDIKKILGISPDKADALALTFAFLVATYEDLDEREDQYYQDNTGYDSNRNSITGY